VALTVFQNRRFDTEHRHAEVLVIGGGHSGIEAVRQAAAEGRHVVLVHDGRPPGDEPFETIAIVAAVMLALAHIMKDSPPDLILSGINRGANLAEDVTYSGTVSAAMEGALAGVRSIALSQAYSREGMGDTVPFAAAEGWAERVLAPLLIFDTAPGTLINVNFPAMPADEVKGIRVCRQGIRDYGRLRIVQRTDPRGYDYYWFGLGPMVETPGHQTDLEAVADGFVSVTPLHLDLTHDESLGSLARQLGV